MSKKKILKKALKKHGVSFDFFGKDNLRLNSTTDIGKAIFEAMENYKRKPKKNRYLVNSEYKTTNEYTKKEAKKLFPLVNVEKIK